MTQEDSTGPPLPPFFHDFWWGWKTLSNLGCWNETARLWDSWKNKTWMKLLKHVGFVWFIPSFPNHGSQPPYLKKKSGSFLDHKPLQSLQLTIKDGKTRYNQAIKNSGQGLAGQQKKHPSAPPKKKKQSTSPWIQTPQKNGSSFARFFFRWEKLIFSNRDPTEVQYTAENERMSPEKGPSLKGKWIIFLCHQFSTGELLVFREVEAF